MQQIVYDEAPYIVLYYDAELHAYRTDKFAGWTNQPTQGGTPLFGYGSGGYNVLDRRQARPAGELGSAAAARSRPASRRRPRSMPIVLAAAW